MSLSAGTIHARLRHAASPAYRPWVDAFRLAIFRMGLGRDSLAMLGLLLEHGLLAKGRRYTADDIDAVVFTDPGMEWANTYALIPRVREVCAAHGLRFIVQAKADPEAQRAWTASRPIGSREDAPWRAERPGEGIEEKQPRESRYYVLAEYLDHPPWKARVEAACARASEIPAARARR